MPMEEEKWRRLNVQSRGGTKLGASPMTQHNYHHHPFFHHQHASSPFSSSGVPFMAASPHLCRTPLGSPAPIYHLSSASSSANTTPRRLRSGSIGLSGLGASSSSSSRQSSASSSSSSSSSTTSSSSSLLLPSKSAYVGVFRHAPATRGFKDLIWEPSFSTGRPSLTQMDLARQERFRTRHVGLSELLQLPSTVYKELMARRRRERLERELGMGVLMDEEYEEDYFVMDEEEGFRVEGGEEWEVEEGVGGRHLCVICLEGFTPWDVVRELPACQHIHHQRCLDVWLRGAASYEACHTRSCPTCKTPIDFFPPSLSVSLREGVVKSSEEGGERDGEGKGGEGGGGGGGQVPRSFLENVYEIPRMAFMRVGNSLMQQTSSGSNNSNISRKD